MHASNHSGHEINILVIKVARQAYVSSSRGSIIWIARRAPIRLAKGRPDVTVGIGVKAKVVSGGDLVSDGNVWTAK